MTRNIIALIGLALLAACSGGDGGDSAAPSTSPPSTPPAQPEFLVATPAGLWRGQATGKGAIVFARPNLQQSAVVESEGHVVYTRETGTQTDIWTVNADGTGDHALVNTPEDETIEAINGPWVIYTKRIETNQTETQEHWSARIDTGAQFFVITPFEFDVNRFQFLSANRIIVTGETLVRSITTTGTDQISYAALTDEEIARRPEIQVNPISLHDEQNLIFVRGSTVTGTANNVFSIPLVGGTRTPLDDDRAYVSLVGLLGGRVVYHRCSVAPGSVGPCDIVSVQTDGGNKAVLASQPANEAAQGFTTDQVIIRRNLNGHDQLIAVPVTGGPETQLMIMTDNEFVDRTVGDLIILRRPTGTWTLDLSGKLKHIGFIAGLDTFGVVGDRICSDFGQVWCMPLDGSGPEVKIATEGKVVGVL